MCCRHGFVWTGEEEGGDLGGCVGPEADGDISSDSSLAYLTIQRSFTAIENTKKRKRNKDLWCSWIVFVVMMLTK